MEDNKIINLAAAGVVALVVAPIVIGVAVSVIGYAAVGVGNVINKVKFNKQIKKGLKDGSIIENDGEYYGVEIVEEA